MILSTIYCDMPGCNHSQCEIGEGSGFPGWGHVVGLVNAETGRETAHICPECKQKIKEVLENGMG